jgi:NAD(P)-dependent dehydrogenase (short-subunit alcohol dehydrogenase family)
MSREQVVMVTGVSSGIGRATAELLTREGFGVSVLDQSGRIDALVNYAEYAGSLCGAERWISLQPILDQTCS